MDKELRKKLADLEASDLPELVERLHGRVDAIDREIEVFATRADVSEHLAALRGWIRRRTRDPQFVPYQRSFDLAREVEGVIAEMETAVERDDPRQALELVEEFLQGSGALIEQTDDSSGAVSMEIRDGAILWLKAARRCRDEGALGPASKSAKEIGGFWVDRLENLMADNGYGLLDEVLPQAHLLLSKDELRELAGRYEAQALASSDTEEGRWQRLSARTKLGCLAWALRDPSIYVRSIEIESPKPNLRQMESIIECHLELDDPKGALDWLDRSTEAGEDNLRLRIEAYEALGMESELIETHRRQWVQSPRASNLEALLNVLPEAEREDQKRLALERAPTIPSLTNALEIYLFLGRPAAGEDLLVQRRAELDGNYYGGLLELVEAFEAASCRLAASLIYRALLDSILARGRSKAYSHAARYYRRLEALADSISDWRGAPDHTGYVADLKKVHFRKRSFWSRVD